VNAGLDMNAELHTTRAARIKAMIVLMFGFSSEIIIPLEVAITMTGTTLLSLCCDAPLSCQKVNGCDTISYVLWQTKKGVKRGERIYHVTTGIACRTE